MIVESLDIPAERWEVEGCVRGKGWSPSPCLFPDQLSLMTLTREDATATRSQGLASPALYSAEAAGGSSARGQGRRGRAVRAGGGEGTAGPQDRRSSPHSAWGRPRGRRTRDYRHRDVYVFKTRNTTLIVLSIRFVYIK